MYTIVAQLNEDIGEKSVHTFITDLADMSEMLQGTLYVNEIFKAMPFKNSKIT